MIQIYRISFYIYSGNRTQPNSVSNDNNFFLFEVILSWHKYAMYVATEVPNSGDVVSGSRRTAS